MADQNPEDARTDQPSDVKARIDVENIADAADDSSAETAQKEQCDTMIASVSIVISYISLHMDIVDISTYFGGDIFRFEKFVRHLIRRPYSTGECKCSERDT